MKGSHCFAPDQMRCCRQAVLILRSTLDHWTPFKKGGKDLLAATSRV